MKKLRSGWLKGWPLQLAPIPLKRLLSETNSLQLERPNSKPLQLDRLREDTCSEPKENELTPSEPNAVSQLEAIAPRPACQLASTSLLRPYELNADSHFAKLSPIPACQLASVSLLRPYELTACPKLPAISLRPACQLASTSLLRPSEPIAFAKLPVISLSPACQLANTSLLRPSELTACSHFEMISRTPACQLASVSLPPTRTSDETPPTSEDTPTSCEETPPTSAPLKLLTPPLESSCWTNSRIEPLNKLDSPGASKEAKRPLARSSLADSESSLPPNSPWRNSSTSSELIEKRRSRKFLPSSVSKSFTCSVPQLEAAPGPLLASCCNRANASVNGWPWARATDITSRRKLKLRWNGTVANWVSQLELTDSEGVRVGPDLPNLVHASVASR